MTDQELVAKVRKLPVPEAAAVGALHAARMPYRSPPKACSTHAHRIASVEWTLVAGTRTLVMWECDLHEVEAHGGSLTTEQRSFLRDYLAGA